MKIAIWHNLPSGGGKRALYYHVRGLVERGHSVEAWCPSTSDRNYLPLGELVTEHVLPIDVPLPGKSAPRGPVGELRGDELRAAKALDEHCQNCAEEINRGGFDILFANSSIIQAVSSIGRYVTTTRVLYLQEPNRGLYEASERGLPWVAIPARTRPWMRPRYLAWFLLNLIGTQQLRVLARDEQLNAKAFHRIFVNSFFSRESLLRAYGLDSTVCYLGVDTQLFLNRHLARENFVVGLGEISPHKNVELVIKAVAQLLNPRPHLVWIGNARSELYHEEMRSLAQACGISFETRTNIGDAELVDTLNRAAMLAYAPRLEPFGFAVLEANACGLPVVGVAEGGLRETIIHEINGLLTGNAPGEMAAGIQRLIDDKNYAEQLGRQGAEIVAEKWSLHYAVSRLEQLLEETVALGAERTSSADWP
jgi:glycosyltransferase involved in cell wall biosynthesis